MVRIQSEIKRALLRSLYRSAQQGAVPLSDAIDAFSDAGYTAIKSGQILVHASGSGYGSSLKVPVLSDQITQENFLALAEEYRNVYDDSVSSMNASVPPISLTDANIFLYMITDDRMQGVRQQQGDWTGLNIPSLGGIPGNA